MIAVRAPTASAPLDLSDGLALGLVALAFSRFSESLEATHGVPPISSLVALGAIAVALVDRRERSAAHPMLLVAIAALAADLAVASWSGLAAADPSTAIGAIDGRLRGMLITGAVVLLVRSPRRLHLALGGIVAATAVVAAVNVLQALLGSYASTFAGLARAEASVLGGGEGERLGGPIGDPNFFAQMLAPGVIVALAVAGVAASRWRRTVLIGTGLVGAAALVLTYSRGGLLALALAILVVSAQLLRWRTIAVVTVPLVIFGAAIVPDQLVERLAMAAETGPDALAGERVDDSAINGRASEALVGLELFRQHPYLGVGIGSYEAHYLDLARNVGLDVRGEPRSAHSLIVETMAETGIVGLAVLVGLAAVALLGTRSLERASRGVDRTLRAAAIAVQGALVAHLAAALLLHSAYPRGLWLLLGLGLACGQVRPAPDPSAARR